MGWRRNARRERAERARERQLDYMRGLACSWASRRDEIELRLERYSRRVRDELSAYRPIEAGDRLLEVGSGAAGAIFFFGLDDAVGIDPLAEEYRLLFPWHARARTLRARGEALPFETASFDIVISDNVIDHAEDPPRIVAEIARVLKPGGILYFTVNVHHPLYHLASRLYGACKAIGIPFEVTPFADHTVHLTPASVERLFAALPFSVLRAHHDVETAKREARNAPPRHWGDRLKRLFYKNATYKVIALREADRPS